MKIHSSSILTATVVIVLALVALSSIGGRTAPLFVYSTIIIIFTFGTYLLVMAKSYINAMMQESKISGDLDARIANLNEYMDKIESRIDKIDSMLEKV